MGLPQPDFLTHVKHKKPIMPNNANSTHGSYLEHEIKNLQEPKISQKAVQGEDQLRSSQIG